ncbi:MAG: response regulator [Verrucomicrobiales bacterium]|nr:response regulator [Verrucomicrobiales bacterium]
MTSRIFNNQAWRQARTDLMEPDLHIKSLLAADGVHTSPEPPERRYLRRVLLVDDDASVRASLVEALEVGSGHRLTVETASSAREAYCRFISWTPSLVLLDLGLPDQDGWKLFENLEMNRPFVPFILITAQPDQIIRARRMGFDAVFEKPVAPASLVDTILGVLGESESQRLQRLVARTFRPLFS